MKKLIVLLFAYLLFTLIGLGQQSTDQMVVLRYDDGVVHDGFAWYAIGGRCAVAFHPESLYYPLMLIGGAVYILPDWPTGQIIGSTLQLEIYNSTLNGFPDEVLYSQVIEIDSTGWLEFFDLDIIIPEGRFFISMQQLTLCPDCPAIGICYSSWNPPDMSYMRVNDTVDWTFGPYHNFMIRAYIDLPYGVNEMMTGVSNISIYPNPAKQSIKLSNPDGELIMEICIINQLGQIVLQESFRDNSINISELIPGIYIVKITSNKGVNQRRLLIE